MALVKDSVLIEGQTIVYDDANGGIAIDYSATLNKIALALESISNNLQDINNTQLSIKALAEGSGLRIAESWAWLSMSSVVKLTQEQNADLESIRANMDKVPKF